MEHPPLTLLYDKPPEEHAAIVARWIVMQEVRLPFEDLTRQRIARGELSYICRNKRLPFGFMGAMRKTWNAKFDDNRGFPEEEIDLAADYLGVYDLVFPDKQNNPG